MGKLIDTEEFLDALYDINCAIGAMKEAKEKIEIWRMRESTEGYNRETMEEVLKPCPFCGGKPRISRIAFVDKSMIAEIEIKCKSCPAVMNIDYEEVDKAFWLWNRRANDGK